MTRKIIKIDQEKCIGCAACANTCHQGAIGMVGGKAQVVRENYCDGFGRCLPVCPAKAISFVDANEQNAPALEPKAQAEAAKEHETLPCGCPGTHAKTLEARQEAEYAPKISAAKQASQLKQWPVQIKLAPVNAPYFNNAHLLIAADCAAYAYGSFHEDFIKGRITLIGCPKLDDADYSEKLTEIIKNNEIKSIIVTRMEVPCCLGLEEMVKSALKASGKMIPWSVKVISLEGEIKEF